MTRIERISSYITDEEKVIDVGCDQALLSKLLAKRKIHSIASDIKQNIIDDAIKSTKAQLKQYIDFRVGNGITLKENEKDYTLVLSGMGTYTILDILRNSSSNINRVITISNNNHDILRNEMNKNGYKIDLEEIIKEKNKYYNLIIFSKGNQELSEKELIVGFNHQNKALLKEKNEYLINKYENILKGTDNEELVKVVNILKNYNY